ncbi:MAG: beta-galactosidase [Armatimonadia bacterium]
MTRSILVKGAVLLAILLTATCLAQQPTTMAVPNAGLEEGVEGPTGWTASAGEGGEGAFAWDTEHKHSGNRSYRVTKLGSGGHTLLSGPMVSVEPGKTVRVTAWVYPLKNLRRGVYFMISQYPTGKDQWDLPNTFGDTSQPLVAGEWQQLSVLVQVRPGNDRLRIQCVQAFAPSDLCWDDFAVTDAAAIPETKPRYEPPVKEMVPDLEAAKAVVARRARAQVRVEQIAGRPRLFVDGKATPWAWYVSPFWNPQDAQVGDFLRAGVRVYLVPLVLGSGVYGERGPWKGPGRYDFAEVDDLLWRILRVDPEGYVVFYMACDPYRDWGRDNPDDVTCDQNGRKAIVDMHPKRWGDDPQGRERFGPSLVSLKLREDVSGCLRALVKHVESSEPGKAVIGYHVAGLNDGQWFQWARYDPADLHLADYCPGAQASFRSWLRNRYHGDEAAFRKAWRNPNLTFETARVPAGDRLWADGDLLDPATHQDVADHTRFYSEGVAENVLALASLLKAETPRRVLCGTYYEDITCNSANHVALGRLLEGDALDYLAGPAAYGIRMAGFQGAVRSVFGSTLLHGKTYLTEQDWRSWHSVPDSPANNLAWGRAETAEIHNAMVRRECGMMLAFGTGTWWYDMSGGWFRDDQIMAGIAEALRAFGRDLSLTEPPRADLAVIVSEESDSYVTPKMGGAYRYGGVLQQIQELNTAGVPYRLYLQSDLGAMKLPEHRAYLFLNPYLLTDTERRAVESLKRDGKLLLFVHAPGVVGAADPAQAITTLSGITVRSAPEITTLSAVADSGDHPLLKAMNGDLTFSGGLKGPAFEVTDPKAVSLGHYQGTAKVACAARDFGDWKAVFAGCPGLSASFLHALAQWSGCWTASEPGDAVYANQRILTVHALYPGEKVLRPLVRSKVTDLTSGQVLSESATEIRLNLRRGETRWFWLDPAQ